MEAMFRRLQSSQHEASPVTLDQSAEEDGASEDSSSSESSSEAERTDDEDAVLAAMEDNPEALANQFASEHSSPSDPSGADSPSQPPTSPSPSATSHKHPADVRRSSSSSSNAKKRPLTGSEDLDNDIVPVSITVLSVLSFCSRSPRECTRCRTISLRRSCTTILPNMGLPSSFSPERERPHPKQSVASPNAKTRSVSRQGTIRSDDLPWGKIPSDSDPDAEDSGIELVLSQRGRIRMHDQHRRVRRVILRSIDYLHADLALKNAFPEGRHKNNKHVYRALLRAAAHYGYADIVKRLKKQDSYATELARVPAQRIPTFRGAVRKLVEGQPGTTFGLTFGSKPKADWLQAAYRYIYPYDYENDTVKKGLPYAPSVFVETLRAAFFKRPNSFGFQICHLFQSSLPEKPNEKELPAPMLALVATAIHAAIEDFKLGHHQPRDFSTNDYCGVYEDHMLILTNIRTQGPVQYHVLMHGLWRQLNGMSGTIGRTANAASSALPNIDDMARE
ncbi:hypothetical protein C8Q77DRAFT_1261945 [Trametes polyzona]|nr:hypothetical protein C8Q77DRAFT_1261945 [Trametes polyzona]